jgi:NOL1/NOP2/sun family putative RNA methylase
MQNMRGDKFYSKYDVFISRMASILRLPHGVIRNIFAERTVSAIRLNNLAGDPERIKYILEDKGVDLEEVPWSPNTYIVRNADKSDLGQTSEYRKGLFYIQNLSSMIPAILLAPTAKDTILDMCAAPGSKTSQLAALMNNKGKIYANDEDAWRSQKLREVLDIFRVRNTEIKIGKGENYGSMFSHYFDKVLLDAPCSGEGQIYLDGESPLRLWSVKRVKSMAMIQKRLIESAFKALKPGGTMIYSTCTLEPAENEDVVQHLLNKQPKAKIESIDLVKSPEFKNFKMHFKYGIKSWNEFEFSDELRKTIRIYPSSEMMGFYVAKIGKER